MRTSKFFLGITIAISCCIVGFGVPSKLEKKVKKVVAKVFDVEETSFAAVSVSKELNDKLPVKITENNFFSIHKEDKLLGYAFLDKASSKTAKFDYLVLFNDKLQIKSSKVLIYREEYGGEIASTRWLKQFVGKSFEDAGSYSPIKVLKPGLELNNHQVDGISGGTFTSVGVEEMLERTVEVYYDYFKSNK